MKCATGMRGSHSFSKRQQNAGRPRISWLPTRGRSSLASSVLTMARPPATKGDSIGTIDERRLQLEMLWRNNRGDFLAEYRRVVGETAGVSGRISVKAMIDRIIEREASEGRIGALDHQGGARHDG